MANLINLAFYTSMLGTHAWSNICVQVIGWSMWFSEYLFLERSWAKDENTLKVRPQVVSIYVSDMHMCLSFNFLHVSFVLLIS